jgi:hypothetical protein
MLLDYPELICPTCKSDRWWYSTWETTWQGAPQWRCLTCNPPLTEKARLQARIIRGNHILNKLRLQIWVRPAGQDVPFEDPDFIAGMMRLEDLVKQMTAITKDCLYIVSGKKLKKCIPALPGIECFSCGNEYWFMAELDDEQKAREEKEALNK